MILSPDSFTIRPGKRKEKGLVLTYFRRLPYGGKQLGNKIYRVFGIAVFYNQVRSKLEKADEVQHRRNAAIACAKWRTMVCLVPVGIA